MTANHHTKRHGREYLRELASQAGVSPRTMYGRLRAGMTPHGAVAMGRVVAKARQVKSRAPASVTAEPAVDINRVLRGWKRVSA